MRRARTNGVAVTAIAAVASLLQSGCQTAPSPVNYTAMGSGYGYAQSPMAGQVVAGVSSAANLAAVPTPYAVSEPAYSASQYQVLESTALGLKERLERVEKAMLRLDRRMQLVERNELNRMSGATLPGQVNLSSLTPQSGAEEQAAMRSLNIGPAQRAITNEFQPVANPGGAYQDGFQAVSTEEDGIIHSALQAAPVSRMPSLADTSSLGAGKSSKPATDVAVWTVRYESDKVWPDRAQLPSSRDIVEALRESANVTLFARGPNPNDKQFRERVKALSRYLAKVSSQDTVPIAALPSPQLDAETIEILATH